MRRTIAHVQWLAAAGFAALATPAMARGVADDVGLIDLVNRLGAKNVPTGTGVVVGQIEAAESPGNYGPNQAHPEFTGKTFIAQSGSPGNSGHATLVGQNFFGTATSIAPDIATIYLYEAGSWATGGLLRTGQGVGTPPLITPGGIKFFNNSWIGSFGSTATDGDCIRRADFVIDRDDVLIINGTNNGGPQSPLMTFTYNGISVGLVNGTHTSGPVPAGYDGAGRMKPEIVAPSSATSFATPIVDAAGALLVETVNSNPDLSANLNAKRSESLKAILLGGGNHRPGWSNNPFTSGPSRGIASAPLDPVFGVDVVNIDRSHLILTGLEQNGTMTVPGSTTIKRRGWDLITMPPLSSRYYRFRVGAAADQVSILTTWHRTVAPTNMSSWNSANFTLTLWRVDGAGQLATLVGDPGLPYFTGGNVVSQSPIDNIEHLFINGLAIGDYVIELKRVDSLSPNWDAAISWLLPKRSGDVNEDGKVDVDDLLGIINGWGLCPEPCLPSCPADLTGNCIVDVDDLLLVINNWG